MIGSLCGNVFEVHPGYCLIVVNGVGYVIRGTHGMLSMLKIGEEKFFYIHDVVREDARELFGFFFRTDLELFERLIGVNGVGPKVALTLLSAGSGDAVRQAIMQGDLGFLTSVPGVGKKTAQKIILDLKGQLVEDIVQPTMDTEVMDALIGLGYSQQKAREAVQTISSEIVDVSLRVREALKYLSK